MRLVNKSIVVTGATGIAAAGARQAAAATATMFDDYKARTGS